MAGDDIAAVRSAHYRLDLAQWRPPRNRRADPGRSEHELSNRPIGDAFSIGQAPRPQDLGVTRHARERLGDQTTLAHPRRADHRDEARRSLRHGPLEGNAERFQLGSSTNERRRRRADDAFKAAETKEADGRAMQSRHRLMGAKRPGWTQRHGPVAQSPVKAEPRAAWR